MSEALKTLEVEVKQARSDHVLDESRSTLSSFAKVGYGFGHVFNDLCGTLWFSYTLLFLKDVLLMPNEAGSYMMLGQITDAISSAMFGFMTDRYSTKRNWHILGTLIVLASFPALFMMQRDKMPYLGNVFYFSLFVSVFQCGWAIVQISHLAILTELGATQADRSKLNSVRYIMTVFSNISVFGLAWLILRVNGSKDHIGEEDFKHFRNIAVYITVTGIITTIIFYVSLSMSNYSELRSQKINSTSDVSPRVKMSSVLKNVELYKIAFLYTFSRLFLVICIIYIPIWINESLKSNNGVRTDNIAIIPMIFFVASFVAAFFLKYINQKFSYMIIYLAGSLISISGCLWVQFSSPSIDANELIGIAVLFGAGSSITQISSLCITSDLMEDSTQWSGLIYSIITFCDKLFSGIIIIMISSLETVDGGKQYYANVLFYNGGIALLGVLVLGTFKSKTKTEKK